MADADGPTPDEAAALALYEAAEWARSYRGQMRVGSGRAAAASRIEIELRERAQRRHLGNKYDPRANATDQSLRRQVALRAGRSPLADKVVTAVWESTACKTYAQAEAAAEAVLRLLSEAINYTHEEPVISAGELEHLADEIRRSSVD